MAADKVFLDKDNTFLNLNYINEVNKRHNKYFGLFENYQINPYTKKSLEFITPKITERPRKFCVWDDIPGYSDIQCTLWRFVNPPLKKYCSPQTEAQRHGWFPKGSGYMDPESYDERFKFSHRTADFIKIKAMLREYDSIFNPKKMP